MSCTFCGNECGGCCKSCGPAPQQSRATCGENNLPVIDTRGGCVPVIRDEDTSPPEPYKGGVLIHGCTPAQCGDKTIGAPVFVLEVTNPANMLLQENTGELILEDSGQFFTVD